MKFLIIILIMFSVILYSKDELPIMLKVTSKNLEIPDDFRNGVSSVLSKNNYSLIDLNVQEEALKQQAESNKNDDCIDDSCLIDTGKMLAAKELVLVFVALKGNGIYSFNIKILDLEKDIIKKTDTMYYKGELNDYEKLFIFAQKFTNKLLNINKNDIVIKSDYITLDIKTKPLGADIYISNKSVGKSPIKLKIKKGKHRIKISKNYYKTKVIELGENNKNKEINIELEKAEKYIITKNIKPKNSIVIITNIEAKEKFKFEKLSNKLELYKGLYVAEIKHKGFVTKEITINLNKNKNIDIKLLKRNVDFLIPYTFTDITVSSGLMYSNLGAGFKLLKLMLNDFHVFEINAKFYRDMANDYFYGDIELQYKLSFIENSLNIGLSIPVRKLFTDKYPATMGFAPGLLFSYNIFNKNGFFIDLELLPFISLSIDGDVDTKIFIKSGLNIGWTLF